METANGHDNPNTDTQVLDRILGTIAGECFGIYTLETRKSDRLDFHEISVWQLKTALAKAHRAGYEKAMSSINGRTKDK